MKSSLVVFGTILLLSAASFLVLNGSQANIFKKIM